MRVRAGKQELYNLRSVYSQRKRALEFCNSTFTTIGEKKFCILHLLEDVKVRLACHPSLIQAAGGVLLQCSPVPFSPLIRGVGDPRRGRGLAAKRKLAEEQKLTESCRVLSLSPPPLSVPMCRVLYLSSPIPPRNDSSQNPSKPRNIRLRSSNPNTEFRTPTCRCSSSPRSR